MTSRCGRAKNFHVIARQLGRGNPPVQCFILRCCSIDCTRRLPRRQKPPRNDRGSGTFPHFRYNVPSKGATSLTRPICVLSFLLFPMRLREGQCTSPTHAIVGGGDHDGPATCAPWCKKARQGCRALRTQGIFIIRANQTYEKT